MKDEHPTREEVLASIVPKSDQLNADDLVTGPITVTITNVRRGNKEQPIFIEIEGHHPFKPCKTMRRVLIAAFSDDPKQWIGQQMTLYCDPDVLFHGVRVGGIRISHLSGLDQPKTFLVTQSKGKRAEVTIHPIRPPEDDAQIKQALEEIAAAETAEALKAVGFVIKQRPKSVQDAVRPAYKERLKTLNAPVSALQAFEQEIEASKGSKAALSKLSVRCNDFADLGPELMQKIEALYAVAADDE